jgi:hypothetical protein
VFAEASTNFFFADAELRLRRVDSKSSKPAVREESIIATGIHQKDHNTLRAVIGAGVYSLELHLIAATQQLPTVS